MNAPRQFTVRDHCYLCNTKLQELWSEHANVHRRFVGKRGIYHCSECDEDLFDIDHLWEHITTNHKQKGCDNCDLGELENPVEKHLENSVKLETYPCYCCDLVCYSLVERQEHLMNLHGPESFRCKHCEGVYNSFELLMNHLSGSICTSMLISCDVCRTLVRRIVEWGGHQIEIKQEPNWNDPVALECLDDNSQVDFPIHEKAPHSPINTNHINKIEVTDEDVLKYFNVTVTKNNKKLYHKKFGKNKGRFISEHKALHSVRLFQGKNRSKQSDSLQTTNEVMFSASEHETISHSFRERKSPGINKNLKKLDLFLDNEELRMQELDATSEQTVCQVDTHVGDDSNDDGNLGNLNQDSKLNLSNQVEQTALAQARDSSVNKSGSMETGDYRSIENDQKLVRNEQMQTQNSACTTLEKPQIASGIVSQIRNSMVNVFNNGKAENNIDDGFIKNESIEQMQHIVSTGSSTGVSGNNVGRSSTTVSGNNVAQSSPSASGNDEEGLSDHHPENILQNSGTVENRPQVKDEVVITIVLCPICCLPVPNWEEHRRSKHKNIPIMPMEVVEKDTNSDAESESNKSVEYNYHCGKCEKSFTSDVQLSAHMKSSGCKDNLYICELCGKMFRRWDLNRHLKAHEEKVPCPHCGEYYKKPTLKRHIDIIHETAPQYVCPVESCQKKFRVKSSLKLHTRRIHDKARDFPCKFPGCDRAFGSYSARQHHESHHTGVRPHKCEYCDYATIQKVCLRLHMKNHHSDVTEKTS